MRIKKVECDQFAGVQDKTLEFGEGLNIVIGDNESGKSSMVDLIFQLLFNKVKLDDRSKDGKEFKALYYPHMASGTDGNYVSGEIQFETSDGTYKLYKEWGDSKENQVSKLTMPNGTKISTDEKVNKELSEVLSYRAGVYNEIVFASQKRDQVAVESIMRSLVKKTPECTGTISDLKSTLNQATLEMGDVAIDEVKKKIDVHMNDLSKKWDFVLDEPDGDAKRKSYNLTPWKNDAGYIVKAFYEYDKARDRCRLAEEAEKKYDNVKTKKRELKDKLREIDKRKQRFQGYRSIIDQVDSLSRRNTQLKSDISQWERDLERWPDDLENYNKIKGLIERLSQATIHELYAKVSNDRVAYLESKDRFDSLKEIDINEINRLDEILDEKKSKDNKLASLDLSAKIKQLGEQEVVVKSISDGSIVENNNGLVEIKEAVEIIVPGILEMQLFPQGIDVDEIKDEIKKLETEINEIYSKYGVNSLKELRGLRDDYDSSKNEMEKNKNKYDISLGDNNWDELVAKNESVPKDIESVAVIKSMLKEICGTDNFESYKGELKGRINGYELNHNSIDELKTKIDGGNTEYNKNDQKLKSVDNIPEEYRGINPEEYEASLQGEIDMYEDLLDKNGEELDGKARIVGTYLGEKSIEDYYADMEEKEAIFNAKKERYQHWKNIYDVFVRLKEESASNPVEDIEKNFRRYLSAITDGGVNLESLDEEMSSTLTSGTKALTYETLSDGTKDTISLAFRLAMLEHIFPDGDGLAVFDDPFTDMDPKRVEQSCKLIQKFAEKNQVIFITCDDKYSKLLEGNKIAIGD